MTNNLTDKFIHTLLGTAEADPAPDVLIQVKKCLLDYLGVALLGPSIIGREVESLLRSLGVTGGSCVIPGTPWKADLLVASLVHGMFGHASELDDGVRYGGMHPGVPIFSALLPHAILHKVSGDAFVRGVIVAYEAAVRLASALQPSHKLIGYHTTATIGTIAAAIGVGVASGCDATGLKHILSAACTSSSGLLQATRDEASLKPYNAGQAAMNAISASLVAKSGFSGPEDILGAPKGFVNIFSKTFNERKLLADSSVRGIEMVYFKPYAACRHAHAPIEAAIRIRKLNNPALARIQSVRVETYLQAIEGHDHTQINSSPSAKMSIPFAVAIGLGLGRADLTSFSDDVIKNRDILSLTEKVVVSATEELTALVPEKRVAIVHVDLEDGSSFSSRVDYPKGEPENPMGMDEVERKYFELTDAAGYPKGKAQRVAECVQDIEHRLGELEQLLPVETDHFII